LTRSLLEPEGLDDGHRGRDEVVEAGQADRVVHDDPDEPVETGTFIASSRLTAGPATPRLKSRPLRACASCPWDGGLAMIRRITGIVLGVLAFLLVYWLTGLGTPSNPNLALALLVGLVLALLWPWVFGLFMVRRVRQNRQNEIDQEVQKQLSQQQNNPPPS
jgi:hypothetical protein